MNELQRIWVESYRGYLNAASPFGEHHTSEYTAALEHADSAIYSLSNLKVPYMQQDTPAIDMSITVDMSRIVAAIETLESSGYTYNGGKLWKPPIGKPPAYLTDWDGEGLPPLGTECEFKLTGKNYQQDFVRVVVLCFGNLFCFMRHSASGNEFAEPIGAIQFRPARSPEEVSKHKATHAMLRYMLSSDEIDYGQVYSVYDAIAAGKIPGVKLEQP